MLAIRLFLSGTLLLLFSALSLAFNPSLLSCPRPNSALAKGASSDQEADVAEPPLSTEYKYISAQGFEVTRPSAPSSQAINSLPRRLLVTTVFLTIPLSLGSNFLGLTSKLIVSSPVPQIASLASSLGLQELFPDAEGYKIYKSPSRSAQPQMTRQGTFVRYSLLVPPQFVQDPAVMLARSQLSDPNREMKMSRSSTSSLIPDVAWGPMGKIDPVTRKSSSDTNISVIKTVIRAPFSLSKTIGSDPLLAGQSVLTNLLCPPNSGREGTLIASSKKTVEGIEYYTIEYVISCSDAVAANKKLRAISVLAGVGDDTLLTYTAVGREGEFSTSLRRSAESFTVI